jgi:hypothetical protein
MGGGVERAGMDRSVGWAWPQVFLLDENRTGEVVFQSLSEGRWHVKAEQVNKGNKAKRGHTGKPIGVV